MKGFVVGSIVSVLVAVSAQAAEPYDLAADIAARKLAAQRDLGRGTSIEVVSEVFVIASAGESYGAARIAERAIAAYFNRRFSQRPDQAVSVYLFPTAGPYQAFCKARWNEPCVSVYGFYTSENRQIVLDVGPGVGTLTHELVHPIMKADFPGAPIWFEEGIASLYEGFYLEKPGEIRGMKNWRWPGLVAALNQPKQGKTISIAQLFGMSDAVFRGADEGLNYALARYFCLWLEQRGWLWPFYHAWRDGFAADPTGEKAFATVVGMQPDQANPIWQHWVRRI